MTDTLNIIFDDLDICLLGFRIEFSCLHIPQLLYNYIVATKYICNTLILSESPPLGYDSADLW